MTLSLPVEGDELHSALQSNLNSALRISSLLIKNEKTNFDELVHQICNLSYLGMQHTFLHFDRSSSELANQNKPPGKCILSTDAFQLFSVLDRRDVKTKKKPRIFYIWSADAFRHPRPTSKPKAKQTTKTAFCLV